MGASLGDITIYYDGTAIADNVVNVEFQITANYICDFYYKLLNGYKPTKTGRICITLNKAKVWDTPWYFGSICNVSWLIDEQKYLSSSKMDKYKYILELLHNACIHLAEIYDWDKAVFKNAYDKIYKQDFYFSLSYPEKKSRDRKKIAQAIIEKTDLITTLYLIVRIESNIEKIKLFEKKNWWWWDSAYVIAKNCRWLDNISFGICSNDSTQFAYYSITGKNVSSNLSFKENNFLKRKAN